jgi:hypothetical protein
MAAGSFDDLVARTQAQPEPWPTGRHKKPRPQAPKLPAQPVYVRPVVSHRRPPPPIDLRAPRPRIVDDVSLIGFSRFTRGRVGARLFRLFFLLVFAGIVVQMVFSIIDPLYR